MVALIAIGVAPQLAAQEAGTAVLRDDSVMIRFVDSDLHAVIQAIGRYLDRPVIFSNLQDARVTLETPRPVPRADLPALLRAVLVSNGLELTEDSTHFRVVPGAAAMSANRAQAGEQAPELFVIRLSHAQAEEVAATVNALYGRASAVGELGVQPSTLNDQLRQSRVPPAAPEPGGPDQTPGLPGLLLGDIVIVPDSRSNSLLVRASPSDFAVVEAAVQELDVRPLQVLIEVLIVEVRRDRGYDFGTEIGMPATRIPGTHDTDVSGTTTGLGLGDFALHVMNLGGVNLDVTLHAAARSGNASILSRPILLTANNELARILVGSQRPFVQVSRSLPTDAPSRDQVVQYKDVGTELTVIPTVSDDGYVMLSITQEVNAATAETAFDAPVISTRAVQTRLLVRDGQTAVLGGLTDRQRDASRSGVPFLSSIPVLGALFGRVSSRSTETELFVFLTPHVIRSDDDIDDATAPYRDRAGRIR
jgi:general secretion pathway protein D